MFDFLTALGTGGLSMAAGAVVRFIPEVFKLITAGRDQKHELAMTALQLDIDKERAGQAIDLVHAQAAISETAAELKAFADAVAAQGNKTGIPFADAVSATIRPFLTYWWCLGIYTVAKVVNIVAAWGQELAVLSPIIMSPFDQQVIAMMLGFWFVDRSIRKQQP